MAANHYFILATDCVDPDGNEFTAMYIEFLIDNEGYTVVLDNGEFMLVKGTEIEHPYFTEDVEQANSIAQALIDSMQEIADE